jgi:hypothetical protein
LIVALEPRAFRRNTALTQQQEIDQIDKELNVWPGFTSDFPESLQELSGKCLLQIGATITGLQTF